MFLVGLILVLLPGVAFAEPVTTFLATTAFSVAGISATWGQIAFMAAAMTYGQITARRAARAARDSYNNSLQDRMATVLATDVPITYAYGDCPIGSAPVAVFTSGNKDQFKHIVYVHCGHESEAIADIEIAGKRLIEYQKDSTGTKFEEWTGSTHTLEFTPDPSLHTNGILSIKAGASAATAVAVAYSLEGATVILTQSYPYASCSYLQKQKKTTAWVTHHLGTPDDPVDAELHALRPTDWPATSVLRGYTYSVVKLDLNQAEFQGGIPEVRVFGKWKKLYDPRTGLTAWSDNNTLAALDYLTSDVCGVDLEELPIDRYITAANVCDEEISIGKRYTFNGAIKSDEDPQQVLEKIAQSMAGGIVSTTWDIYAGKYVAPVMAFDLENRKDVVGKFSLSPGVSAADLFNGVKGQFIGAETQWVMTDVKPYINAVYVASDGKNLWTDITFPYTNTTQRIHNLARIYTEDQRNSYTVVAEFSLKAWAVRVGDRVTLSSVRFGWDNKVFRVTGKKFSPSSFVELTLKEDAESIWDEADAVTVDDTPNTSLPDPFNPPEITGLTLSAGDAELIKMADGTIVSRILAEWDEIPASDLWVDVEWAPAGSDVWASGAVTDALGTYLSPVQDGVDYIVRARTRSKTFQAESDWTYEQINVVGKMSPPAAPTGAVLSISGAGLRCEWNANTEVDIAGYEVRESDGGWGSALGRVFRGAATSCTVSVAGTGVKTVYLRAYDTSGNYSTTTTASITIAAPDAPTALSYEFADTATTIATVTVDFDDADCLFGLKHYIVSDGVKSWTTKSSTFTTQVNWTGNQTFTITTVDNIGNSSAPASIIVALAVPGTPTGFRAEVIDNNVLMYWTLPAKTSLPVSGIELRSGATWESATVIGRKTGGFTTVFESVGGEKKYWIAAVDTNNQVGAPVSLSTTVSQPPDYVLHADYDSTFAGTKSNIAAIGNAFVVPVNTTETWAEHFTSRGWSSPQDQINAGYPIYIQPSTGSGYYEETIDYGTTLAGSKITVTLDGEVVAGSASTECQISVSADGSTWADSVAWSYYATAFRYVKVRVTVTAASAASLYKITGLNIRLDAKLKNDAGSVNVLASDIGGTTVYFNVDFIDVTSIVPGVRGTAPLDVVIDFDDAPNPESFKILLFDSGVRVDGYVSWSAKGY